MSNPSLPAELLDRIVDFLYDSRSALKSCCLVSKSWIPRTRVHLFASVAFYTPESLRSWRKAFPDPSTSPACYTRLLTIHCPQVVTATDAEEGGWIPTFSRVVNFVVDIRKPDSPDAPRVSLVPFHGFSPALKSLRVKFTVFPASRVSNLIHSFTLLEEVSVTTYDKSDIDDGSSELPTIVRPSSSPVFTGTLTLWLDMGMDPIASRLLSLPTGLQFQELRFLWYHQKDVSLTRALIERCYSTLEFLCIDCRITDKSSSGPIDLSKATNLKEVAFELDPKWVAMTLRTVTQNHRDLREIILDLSWILCEAGFARTRVAIPDKFLRVVGATVCAEWLEVDRLLVQLSESHWIRPKVLFNVPSYMEGAGARRCVESLLPELKARGIVDLIGREYGS